MGVPDRQETSLLQRHFVFMACMLTELKYGNLRIFISIFILYHAEKVGLEIYVHTIHMQQ